jgi:hypothetical protein
MVASGVAHHNHSNSTTNLNLMMAETIASARPFHHAKSGSTSAVSRNLNKSCKESFTTNCAANKTKDTTPNAGTRPILNQVLNKILENSNAPGKQ